MADFGRTELKSKECIQCNTAKPLTEFHKNKRTGDGHCNACKACRKEYKKAYQAANSEKIREQKKAYYAVNRDQILENGRAWREKNKEARAKYTAEYDAEYKTKYPAKIKAINAVNNAIKAGRMARPDLCECCGSKCKVQAHHCDYSKQIDVEWLCSPCHYQWHAKHGEGLNGERL